MPQGLEDGITKMISLSNAIRNEKSLEIFGFIMYHFWYMRSAIIVIEAAAGIMIISPDYRTLVLVDCTMEGRIYGSY